MVNILPNYRSGNMFGGGEQEFREGDRAWPGAAIVELPDLSSVHLEARLDESDRGRLKASQEATVRIEAIPGRDFKARINDISVLARVDFSSGWPPTKNFGLNLILIDGDAEDPSGHERGGAHRRRARARRRCSCPPNRSFSATARRSSTGSTARRSTKRPSRFSAVAANSRSSARASSAGDRIAQRRPPAELIRRTD